jgi:hypothetical protein
VILTVEERVAILILKSRGNEKSRKLSMTQKNRSISPPGRRFADLNGGRGQDDIPVPFQLLGARFQSDDPREAYCYFQTTF